MRSPTDRVSPSTVPVPPIGGLRGGIAALAMAGVLATAFTGWAASPGALPGRNGMAPKSGPKRLRQLPLESFKDGLVLVARERLSSRWSERDSSVRVEVRFRAQDTAWLLMQKADPEIAGAGRKDWRLPADVVGALTLRFEDAATGRVLSTVATTILPPAGSPETGPYLETLLEPASADSGSPVRNIPYRTAKRLGDIQHRLGSASGGSKCLPDYATLKRFVLEDRSGVPGGNGVPILPSRVRYHYWDSEAKTVKPAEFRGIGFLSEKAMTNRVTFMLADEYAFTNLPDTVVKVDIRIGGDSISLAPGQKREYVFATDGHHTVLLRAVTRSGEAWEQAAILDVKTVLDPDSDAQRRKLEKITGLPIESGYSDVVMRSPEEIDSLSRSENNTK